MENENILIFGGSEHCRYTIDIIEQVGKYKIIGILDNAIKKGVEVSGYKILGKIEDLTEIMSSYKVKKGIIAIGDNYDRYRVTNQISRMTTEFSFISAIHPSTITGKNVKIGEGTLIMAGVIINNDTSIGKHCFLATKASVDHDSSVGDYSSVSAGATLGGEVKVGFCTAIALGVNIIHGRTIGDHTVIGAGALVVKDLGDNIVAYGIPAKEIRKRENGQRYL